MGNESEVILRQMEETRTSLAEKLETLEHQVVDTVQQATCAVTDTVETVKEAVHESVETVKDSVSETVETVKDTFDLKRQFDQHPWGMFGGSVVLGYLGGCLLGKGSAGKAGGGAYATPPAYRNGGKDGYAPGRPLTVPEADSVAQPASSGHNWLDELGTTLAPEINKLKGLAIGTMLGIVRDLMARSAPADLGTQLSEVLDNLTIKLGGQPIRGPLLRGQEEDTSTAGGVTDDQCISAGMGRPVGAT